MNKRETIRAISEKTGIDTETCIKVTDSLETVLSDELEKSGGVKNAFDKIHNLLDIIKDKEDQPVFKENKIFAKLAIYSGATEKQCIEIINTLIDILNHKIEVSKSAKMKFDIAYKLTNFFKH